MRRPKARAPSHLPTTRRTSRRVPTTLGTGHPWIRPVEADHPGRGARGPRTLRLRGEVNVIGSADSADIVISGLARWHAEIRRTESDEYVLRPLDGQVTLNGRTCARARLRAGDQIACGTWTFSFGRDARDGRHRPTADLVEPGGVVGHLAHALHGAATRARRAGRPVR